MKEKHLFLVLGLVFLVLLLLGVTLILFKPVHVRSVPAEVMVDDAIGFKLDNDKFYFGRVKPGASAVRDFTFMAPFDGVLIISSSGDMGSWIIPDKKRILLVKGESYPLKLVLSTPRFTSYGNYSADVHFTVYRPFTKIFFADVRE